MNPSTHRNNGVVPAGVKGKQLPFHFHSNFNLSVIFYCRKFFSTVQRFKTENWNSNQTQSPRLEICSCLSGKLQLPVPPLPKTTTPLHGKLRSRRRRRPVWSRWSCLAADSGTAAEQSFWRVCPVRWDEPRSTRSVWRHRPTTHA